MTENKDKFILTLEYNGRTQKVIFEKYPTIEDLKKDIEKILPEIYENLQK